MTTARIAEANAAAALALTRAERLYDQAEKLDCAADRALRDGESGAWEWLCGQRDMLNRFAELLMRDFYQFNGEARTIAFCLERGMA